MIPTDSEDNVASNLFDFLTRPNGATPYRSDRRTGDDSQPVASVHGFLIY